MLTVFVRFSISHAQSRRAIAQDFANVSELVYGVPGLLRKYFIISEDGTYAGGIYLWESRSAADDYFTENFKRMVRQRYGATPKITYFDCPIVVDNQFNYEFQNLAA
ncbi:MAG: YdhR family protein [Leptolyngbyaceae cyanobacterium]